MESKKYADLRPKNVGDYNFFLNYQKKNFKLKNWKKEL